MGIEQITIEDMLEQLTPAVTQQIILKAGGVAPKYSIISAENAPMVTPNPTVTWYTDTLSAFRTTINNVADDYDETTTELVVASGAIFRANSVVYAEATGELIFVTAVSGNTITVKRGFGGTTAAAESVAHQAALRTVGFAKGEGTGLPKASQGTPLKNENTVQQFSRVVELSGLMKRSGTLTEETRGYQRRKELQALLRDIEHAMTFGSRNDTVTDAEGKIARAMQGLYGVAGTVNVEAVDGTLSKDAFNAFVAPIFERAQTDRLRCYAGSTLKTSINTIYEKLISTRSSETIGGLNIAEVITPFGQVDVVLDWSLSGIFAGDGIFTDPSQLRIRHTDGMLPHLRADVQDAGDDVVKDEWRAELTLVYGDPGCMGLMQGVTGAA